MKRKQLETQLEKAISILASKVDFELCSTDFSGSLNHHIIYRRKTGTTTFFLHLRIMTPNFLKLQVLFYASDDIIDGFYESESENITTLPLRMINLDIDDYRNTEAKEKRQHFYITDDSGYIGVNIPVMAEKVFDRYFVFAHEELIPKLNNSPKMEAGINCSDNFRNNEMDLSPFCYPIQNQALAGVALASICKKSNYREVLLNYLNYCKNDFEKGEDESIDRIVAYLDHELSQ